MTKEFVTLSREVLEQALEALIYCEAPDSSSEEQRFQAAIALRAALEQPQNHVPDAGNMIPAGWKLVPEELTQAMIDQMRFGWSDISTAHILDRWKRTVAAAAQAPAADG